MLIVCKLEQENEVSRLKAENKQLDEKLKRVLNDKKRKVQTETNCSDDVQFGSSNFLCFAGPVGGTRKQKQSRTRST
jgi:hypothetical protein